MLSRCLNFPRLTCCATVCASQDHKCWAVVWTSQDPNPKPFGSCLNLSRLRTETVGQLFELPKNKNVEQVFELPQTNLLCNCLRIPRLLVLGSSSYFPRLKTKYVENLVEFCRTRDRIGWSFVWTFQDHTPKRLGSCLNFPKLVTETVGQLFDIFQIRGRTRWAVA